MDVTVNVDIRRVRQQLDALEAGLRKRANKAGLRAIAKPLRDDLKASLPVRTGILRRSIGYKTLTKQRMGEIGLFDDDAIEVAATKKVMDKSGKRRHQTFKLRFISYGTEPHEIRNRRRGAKSLAFGGRHRKHVSHPGITGKNYLKNIYGKYQPHMQNLFISGVVGVLKKHGVELT